MVQAWLERYVEAWLSYDNTAIADLWTEDAIWEYPFGVRARGRDAIVAEWLSEAHLFRNDGYDARYEVIAVDGDIAVSHGRTRYFNPGTDETVTEYDNVWVLRFGPDGRCSEFHEWYAGRAEDDPTRAMPADEARAPDGPAR
jgi:ketosteroid isomerase-like protein